MVTLLQATRTLADEMGDQAVFTTTAAGGDVRSIVSTSLIDEGYGATLYDEGYLYVVDGPLMGVQKRVRDVGFAGVSGTLVATSDYSQVVPSGTTVEWSALLPRIRYGRKLGYREILNQAARRLWIRSELHLTGVADQFEYSLSPYWWLSDRKRLLGVKDPVYGSYGVPMRTARGFNFRYDAESPVLEITGGWTWQTGDDITLMVVRPANSRMRVAATARAAVSAGGVTSATVITGGEGFGSTVPAITASGGGGTGATFTAVLTAGVVTSITTTPGAGYISAPHLTIASPASWTEQTDPTAGFVSDADEMQVDLNLLVVVAKSLAYRNLANPAPGVYVADYAEQAKEWAAVAAQLKELEAPDSDGDMPELFAGQGSYGWNSKGFWD